MVRCMLHLLPSGPPAAWLCCSQGVQAPAEYSPLQHERCPVQLTAVRSPSWAQESLVTCLAPVLSRRQLSEVTEQHEGYARHLRERMMRERDEAIDRERGSAQERLREAAERQAGDAAACTARPPSGLPTPANCGLGALGTGALWACPKTAS